MRLTRRELYAAAVALAISPVIPEPKPSPLTMGLRKEFLEAYRMRYGRNGEYLKFEAAPGTTGGVKLHWSKP